jgi:hypothetical protein
MYYDIYEHYTPCLHYFSDLSVLSIIIAADAIAIQYLDTDHHIQQ